MTSIASYGQLPPTRQREIIQALGAPVDDDEDALQLARDIVRRMRSKAGTTA
jgi:hypothetical protein